MRAFRLLPAIMQQIILAIEEYNLIMVAELLSFSSIIKYSIHSVIILILF